ncbi:hypothetical protein Zmor_024196 [Zophobas morio]|uniref:SUN domain-containing protein n=1 Tax=Zophobas morio TaxID=2755281 RepID=A0AA38I2N3_9CUCU|nr:hypothetical protein Zmor_024196 [Zophobas morio]
MNFLSILFSKYPKTDYTYSRHSRDRVELAPGVVQMPNMSRRTIHSDSSTNTDSYSYLASKSHLLKQRLFSSTNNNEENDESYKIYRSSSTQKRTVVSVITSVFVSIYTVIYWCFNTVYTASNSTMIYFGKKLHHLASRVMLLDTWLLRKSAGGGKRTRAVVALCLLPLLLFAAWFLLSSLGSAIYWSYLNPSSESVSPPFKPPPILTPEENDILPPLSSPLVNSNSDSNTNNFVQLNTDEIIEKVLQNPKIYNIINNYHNDIKTGKESDEKLLQVIAELKIEVNKMKSDLLVLQQTKNADMDRVLSQIRTENVRNLARLTQKMNRCCSKQMIDLEPYITKIVGALLNDPEFLSNQKGLTDWLHSLFVAKQHLENRLTNLTETLTNKFDISVENTANQVMDKVVTRLSDRPFDSGSVTEEQIKKIVHASLKIYDADRTGLVDYAMEPLGGEIVTTRCTESYHSGTAVISVLGLPVWYPTISPRVVITPGINPGECWAFQNFPGFLVIKLAARVNIEAFSMEHVSRLLVPGGKIDSAPKEFEVFGLETENERDPVKIGEYVYDYDGDPIQFFAAQQKGLTFAMVEIRIKSNHGNPNYTCLYRFRVHGSVNNEPS